ncbi:MAG: RdgB/HAM1 family non-canonical purine NTP pyrophosphatase [Myxococcaceae bacterium]
MNLVLATTNRCKVAELTQLLSLEGVLALDAFRDYAPPEETGATFEANAILKARSLMQHVGLPALGEDSGLCVDALGGAPGIHSARYAPGTDADRVSALLSALRDVPAGKRAASFQCALCLCLPDQPPTVVRAECRGEIAFVQRGAEGFGYDPVFVISPMGQTFAELPMAEKLRHSHRAKAAAALFPHIQAMRSLQERRR